MSLGILEKIQGAWRTAAAHRADHHASQWIRRRGHRRGRRCGHGLPPGRRTRGAPMPQALWPVYNGRWIKRCSDEMARSGTRSRRRSTTPQPWPTPRAPVRQRPEALARLPGLKQKLVDELNTLGSLPDYSGLDPKAVSSTADGNFSWATTWTASAYRPWASFRQWHRRSLRSGLGRPTSRSGRQARRCPPARSWPGHPGRRAAFQRVTLAVGAPEIAVGVKAGVRLHSRGSSRYWAVKESSHCDHRGEAC